jgi:AcrR family transcriptional regulator
MTLPTTAMITPPSTTRDALLDAAETLFSERGYASVGIREIAEYAHANLASIKYHFGSKSELYLETVRRVMGRGEAEAVWDVLREPPVDAGAAAASLSRFIHLFLQRLLMSPEGSRCCSLMVREAAEPSDAIDAVVRDYVRPHRDMLVSVIAVLRPELSKSELALSAQSVLAQVLHFRVFRAFVERLDVQSPSGVERVKAVAAHIARFTLTALGCTGAQIDSAVEAGREAIEPASASEGSTPAWRVVT